MNSTLNMSSSPHITGRDNTRRIMADVIIALIPSIIAGAYYFGPRIILVTLVSVLSCVLWEYVSRKLFKKSATIGDLSAVVTGVLLALNLPPAIPYWIVVIGSFVAIVLIKQLFGGIGQNFMNPALGARVILMVSWAQQMSDFTNPLNPDAISSATPLTALKTGEGIIGAIGQDYFSLFIGNPLAGAIGETSVVALVIGGIYLIYRKVISPVIPVTYLASASVIIFVFGGDKLFTGDFLYHILIGGIVLGAIYMATDYSTSPVTFTGKIIMGLGCGIFTAIIRLYSIFPGGTSFAILLMNVLTPLIDRYTIPRSFGGKKNV